MKCKNCKKININIRKAGTLSEQKSGESGNEAMQLLAKLMMDSANRWARSRQYKTINDSILRQLETKYSKTSYDMSSKESVNGLRQEIAPLYEEMRTEGAKYIVDDVYKRVFGVGKGIKIKKRQMTESKRAIKILIEQKQEINEVAQFLIVPAVEYVAAAFLVAGGATFIAKDDPFVKEALSGIATAATAASDAVAQASLNVGLTLMSVIALGQMGQMDLPLVGGGTRTTPRVPAPELPPPPEPPKIDFKELIKNTLKWIWECTIFNTLPAAKDVALGRITNAAASNMNRALRGGVTPASDLPVPKPTPENQAKWNKWKKGVTPNFNFKNPMGIMKTFVCQYIAGFSVGLIGDLALSGLGVSELRTARRVGWAAFGITYYTIWQAITIAAKPKFPRIDAFGDGVNKFVEFLGIKPAKGPLDEILEKLALEVEKLYPVAAEIFKVTQEEYTKDKNIITIKTQNFINDKIRKINNATRTQKIQMRKNVVGQLNNLIKGIDGYEKSLGDTTTQSIIKRLINMTSGGKLFFEELREEAKALKKKVIEQRDRIQNADLKTDISEIDLITGKTEAEKARQPDAPLPRAATPGEYNF